MSKRRRRRLRISRDTILFVVGLLGIAYETLIAGGDRPTLIVLFGAMIGLPTFLRVDERKSTESADNKDEIASGEDDS